MTDAKDHRLSLSPEEGSERYAPFPEEERPASEPSPCRAAERQDDLYLTLFEHNQDAQLLVDPQGAIRKANPAAAELYGLTRDELASRPLSSLALNPERCEEALRNVLLKGRLRHWETVHLHRRGNPLFLLVNAALLPLDGNPLIACSLRDLTDYHPGRGPLRRWDAVLEAAVYASGQVITPTGRELEVQKILACLGQAAGVHRVFLFRKCFDAAGTPCISHHCEWVAPGIAPLRHHPRLRALRYEVEGFQRWGRVLDRGGVIAGPIDTFPLEERRLLSRFSVKSVALVPILADRKAWGLLGFDDCKHDRVWSLAELEALRAAATAIGSAVQRERWESQLRESEERYRNLVEFSPDGVAIIREWEIVLANSALARIGGYEKADELKGMSVLELFHPECQGAAAKGIRQVLDAQAALPPTEFRLFRGESAPLIVEVTGTAFPQGESPACLLVFRDVTARKEMEDHLRKVQKMEAMAILAGGLAHDFANLLQVLTSSLHLLQKRLEDCDSAAATEVEALAAHVKRGAALTRQLLLFSRREVGLRAKVDLNALTREAARFLGRLLRDEIALRLELQPGQLWIMASPDQMEEVLLNLVINAQDAMPGGGILGVRTGLTDEGRVYLAITDTGTGIPAAIQSHVFEPFFSTKAPGQGTGLGLSVVQRIVQEYGGAVEVKSQEGLGSTFLVTLPAAEPGGAPADSGAAAPPARAQGERVLLVEDEPLARDGLQQILENLGYTVSPAASGEEASAAAERHPPQVLLTDLSLPGQSGAALARELKDRHPSLQVIIMSGFVAEESQNFSATLSGARFLQKPLDTDQLARELANALASPCVRPGGRSSEG